MDAWRLDKAVNLRPEGFGGMAFHREQGITLELDEEAYCFLCSCLDPGPLPAPGHPAACLVPQLVRLGFLCPAGGEATTRDVAGFSSVLTQDLAQSSADGFTLSAPEVVHVAITACCTRSCPGCYVSRSGGGQELTVAEWCALIDQWASMRVFQLAVGGGEPSLYEGLFDVLRYARERGIIPNLTTNGTLIDAEAVRELECVGVGRVNVSWNRPADGDQDRRTVVVSLPAAGNLTGLGHSGKVIGNSRDGGTYGLAAHNEVDPAGDIGLASSSVLGSAATRLGWMEETEEERAEAKETTTAAEKRIQEGKAI